MTRLVAVAGSSPDAGKSTLCAGLADWLRAGGLQVDHFKEEEVLTRDAFAPLAREFTTTGAVQLQTLLETTESYLATAEEQGVDVAVTDALVPFVPSLMGWGYSEAAMTGFLAELAGRPTTERSSPGSPCAAVRPMCARGRRMPRPPHWPTTAATSRRSMTSA